MTVEKQDISAESLMAALSDPEAAKKVMAEMGWSEEDLVSRAEELSKEIQESLASVCVV